MTYGHLGIANTRVEDYDLVGLDGPVHILSNRSPEGFKNHARPRVNVAPPSLRSYPGATPLPASCRRVAYPHPHDTPAFLFDPKSRCREAPALCYGRWIAAFGVEMGAAYDRSGFCHQPTSRQAP